MKIQHWAWLMVALTFVLLLAGGLVHSTGSALACPDWPLCYGQVFPKMVGGVLFEHSHRLIAATVGLITLVFAMVCWNKAPNANFVQLTRLKSPRALTLFGLALVIFQGVLGGITVLLKIQPIVSTFHLATSLIFFAWALLWAVTMTPQTWAPLSVSPKMRQGVLMCVGLLYVQMVLGAFVRHTGAGLACGNNPVGCDSTNMSSWGPAVLQLIHRGMAIIFALLALAVAHFLFHQKRHTLMRRLAVSFALIVVGQIALGVLTVHSFIAVPWVVAHLGGAALLWAHVLMFWWFTTNDAKVGQPTTPWTQPAMGIPHAH